jgi:ubiquinone/menaquinone biosynthesis C-methylase UbiE
MPLSSTNSPTTVPLFSEIARCISCSAHLERDARCPRCPREYIERDGIFDAIGPLSGRNRIVASFYDGPGWVKFRPWEQGFLILQGGVRRARMEILRHVFRAGKPVALGLEVGIGSGENLAFLPAGSTVYGVDIARTQLELCRDRHPAMAHRLVWAEAEDLPFEDATFDASWSVGGFNYFNDHERTLREMRRVTRPGGPVVIADELPSLHRAGLGHLLGIPSFDAWWLRRLGLDRDFVKMVLEFDVDLPALFEQVWPQAMRHRIWHRLGYCFVETSTN